MCSVDARQVQRDTSWSVTMVNTLHITRVNSVDRLKAHTGFDKKLSGLLTWPTPMAAKHPIPDHGKYLYKQKQKKVNKHTALSVLRKASKCANCNILMSVQYKLYCIWK